uniref:Uncharacterized protein n=1 Tax=Desertifilum tharense IPPAS B-1220 TaxID=1781255 RepID=A0ACD5GRZ8_9CYAN
MNPPSSSHSALSTLFPLGTWNWVLSSPTSPSPHPLSHSALSTLHSALFLPLST